MELKFLVQLVFGCTLLFFCSEAFVQELILEKADGGSSTFRINVANASSYNLQNVTRVCARGLWDVYGQANYTNILSGFGNQITSSLVCVDKPFPYQSFRHRAASNTDDSALSLYTGSLWDGVEYFVNGNSLGGIPNKIQTITLSGKIPWTVFEGTKFDGPSRCIESPPQGFYIFNYPVNSLNLSTVGSVLRNCTVTSSTRSSLFGYDQRDPNILKANKIHVDPQSYILNE